MPGTVGLAGLLATMTVSLAMLVLGYVLLSILIGALFLLVGFLLGLAALAGSLAVLRRGDPTRGIPRLVSCCGGAFFALACLALMSAAAKRYGGRVWLFAGPLLASSLVLLASGLRPR